MDYRLYKADDFQAIYAIEELCFQPPFRFGRSYMRRLVGAPNAATWIAEDDGGMAGFVVVEWTQEIGGVSAYIETIEVAPQYRGRGIGGELLRCSERAARNVGASVAWLHVDKGNAAAIRLYEAHGYRFHGEEDHFYAPGRGALLYRKSLHEETAA